MKVLFIDDNVVFRQRLALSVGKRGYTVASAEAAEALAVLADFCPDVVCVDLKMPGQGGLSLIPQIKAVRSEVKIIVLTGYGSIATAMEAAKHGAADYLTKPAGIQQIINALEGVAKDVPLDVPSLDQVEWEHLQRVLADCDHNVTMAAKLLGIDRRSLQRKLARYAPAQPCRPSER